MRTRKPGVRDRILDATNGLLARYGYRKMSMTDLAREAGVGKGTLYLYFSSKEDVALSSIDRLVEKLEAREPDFLNSDDFPHLEFRRSNRVPLFFSNQ